MLFLGEYSGARILTYGTGISQVGDDYQLDVTTWDVAPAGDVGDCVFRSVDVAFAYTNGYSIGVTPIVDGVAQAEHTFSGSGSGTNGQAQAQFAARGTRISARVRTLSRAGDIELRDIITSYAVIRQTP